MRQRQQTVRSLTLIAALATLAGAGMVVAPSTAAQNAAMQRADRAAGSRAMDGTVNGVDRAGRIVTIDRRTFLLGDAIALQGIAVGQQVQVTFEETGIGSIRRAVRLARFIHEGIFASRIEGISIAQPEVWEFACGPIKHPGCSS